MQEVSRIRPVLPVEVVRPVLSSHDVPSGAADEAILARSPSYLVGADAAVDQVLTDTPSETISAESAAELVVASVSNDRVVATPAADHLATRAPDEPLGRLAARTSGRVFDSGACASHATR